VANEAKEFAAGAINGAHAIVSTADQRLQKVLDMKDSNEVVGSPGTKYFLPVYYGLTGEKILKLGHLKKAIEEAKSLLRDVPADELYLPYLGSALDAGVAALFAQEVIEALVPLIEPKPPKKPWLGAPSDRMVSEQGNKIIKKRVAGFVTFIGAAPSNKIAEELALGLAAENLYVFLVGSNGNVSMAQQLDEQRVEFGWDSQLIPLGAMSCSQVHVLGFVVRIAIILGKVNPGDYRRILKYCENNIFGFFMIPGDLDDEKRAAAAGATSFGFLTIAKPYVHQLLPVHTLHRLR